MRSPSGCGVYYVSYLQKGLSWHYSKKKKRHSQSYACPSVIGAKKEYTERLLHHLQRTAGTFDVVYTRNEEGRAELPKCRRRSYINRNEIYIHGKKMVRTCWE